MHSTRTSGRTGAAGWPDRGSPPRRRLLAGVAAIAAVAAAVLTAGAAGAARQGSPAEAGKPAAKARVVGFSQIGAESAWRTAETASIREEAALRGVELRFSDAQQKQENQVKALRSFIAQKVDAIILAPVVETGWEPVLKEIKAAGIPVILVDRGVKADPSLYATLIASDFVDEGRQAGRWLARRLGGKGTVVELQGTVGSAPAIDRQKGFMEAMKDQPGIKVLYTQSGDFTRARGKSVMEAFLKKAAGEGARIDAVYAHNDDMALGAMQAIERAGMTPGKDVILVSIDGTRPAFEAMAAGTLDCVVECNPLLGPAAFDAVEKALSGKPLPPRTLVQDRLFEKSEAAAALPGRKY